jgi:hypothetical protein
MPATLDVTCPNCGKALKVPADLEGRRVKCKGCDEAFVVKAPKAKKLAKTKEAPPPPPPPPAPAYKRPHDEDEDDNPNPITVVHEDDVARCPHCAVELDPPDAVVCSNCGFNNRTRVKAESKKVHAATGGDWASHLAPGIIALLLAIAIIVTDIICLSNMEEWLTGSDLQDDAVDPVTGKKKFLVRPGAFVALIWAFSIVILIPAFKFAWNRLVRDYRPEEKVKK